jgi:hypothetical protein
MKYWEGRRVVGIVGRSSLAGDGSAVVGVAERMLVDKVEALTSEADSSAAVGRLRTFILAVITDG